MFRIEIASHHRRGVVEQNLNNIHSKCIIWLCRIPMGTIDGGEQAFVGGTGNHRTLRSDMAILFWMRRYPKASRRSMHPKTIRIAMYVVSIRHVQKKQPNISSIEYRYLPRNCGLLARGVAETHSLFQKTCCWFCIHRYQYLPMPPKHHCPI